MYVGGWIDRWCESKTWEMVGGYRIQRLQNKSHKNKLNELKIQWGCAKSWNSNKNWGSRDIKNRFTKAWKFRSPIVRLYLFPSSTSWMHQIISLFFNFYFSRIWDCEHKGYYNYDPKRLIDFVALIMLLFLSMFHFILSASPFSW